ncbi:MAG TPA: hypothetical protein VJW76_05415 [Verrucomicrobiae bacterium]|nr:hypothetical protein [Verrucomicrobiae bacterium]
MNASDPALLQRFLGLIRTPDLPDLGPEPRPGRWPLAELHRAVTRFAADEKLTSSMEELLRSTALLWHDHLDASHEISQDIHSPEGSFLHGIMHRREPDYGNAKYWFHRVGRHPSFPECARQVASLLEGTARKDIADRLVPNGSWDPFAFIDVCEEAAELTPEDPTRRTLQTIQRVEFDSLVATFF